ncbi:alpha-1,2-fucosyltransferase [Planktomarina temperata]|nr:alpha-1,2-fucosyltransferase [Planktomarina temperata]
MRKQSHTESDKRSFSVEKLQLINDNIGHLQKVNLFTFLVFKFRIVKLLTRNHILDLFDIFLDGYFIKNSNHINAIKHFSRKVREQVPKAASDECGLHVRAGDLLRQPQNQLCNQDYYYRAIQHLKESTNIRAIHIYTEDIVYAKSILPDLSEFEVSYKSGNEISDFLDLCSYQYLICANSTFSWMAGALGYSQRFISTEYFYQPGDKPQNLSKEVVINYTKSSIDQ